MVVVVVIVRMVLAGIVVTAVTIVVIAVTVMVMMAMNMVVALVAVMNAIIEEFSFDRSQPPHTCYLTDFSKGPSEAHTVIIATFYLRQLGAEELSKLLAKWWVLFSNPDNPPPECTLLTSSVYRKNGLQLRKQRGWKGEAPAMDQKCKTTEET